MLAMSLTEDVIGQLPGRLEERGPERGVEVDGVFKVQLQPVAGAVENLFVVSALVFMPEKQRFHAGAG